MDYVCRILVTDEEGQSEAGKIVLEEGQLSTQAAKGKEATIATIMSMRLQTKDGEFVGVDEPEKWIEALPRNLHGSYVRAELLV